MTKKIAVQKELIDLKEELKLLGYDVVDIEDGERVDAIVYIYSGGEIPHINYTMKMDTSLNMDNYKGAILINAYDKTIEDIRNIIENKIYDSLI